MQRSPLNMKYTLYEEPTNDWLFLSDPACSLLPFGGPIIP